MHYIYSDDLKLKDALQMYFSKYHFKNGGYDLKWFKIKLGPFFIPFPNISARVDAVKIHDIHHVITEYPAILKGEAEIGPWEIAIGCSKYYVAWILNFGSFFYGILFFQRSIFNAFLAGRRCKTNYYYNTSDYELLLDKTIGELRQQIGTNVSSENSFQDYLLFYFYCLIIIFTFLIFLTTIFLLIKFTILLL